jgi:YEATS domain-containing protein 4
VFVTSAATAPPKEGDVENIDYIPGGADDLGYMIKRISFKLYDTYPNANRGVYLLTQPRDIHVD